ncbi:MAG: NADH-quinone oxidoreductase subunit L [Gammaproteobacteria bacterium]
MQLNNIAIIMTLLPLLGALTAGLFGKIIGRKAAHRVTIALMIISFICACMIFKAMVLDGHALNNVTLYTWGISGSFKFTIGFLIDRLSAMMVMVVTFVSLCVHIYTIGYMADDTGYQRFFSYVSLFTFAMLTLVLANSFVLLFFGWEGVGLVSYLLISFWFNRESAIDGGLKAFLVNRVGDLGFLLGIAAVLAYFGTVDYLSVFQQVPTHLQSTMSIIPGHQWSVISVICILLFIGAMGKSAQVPLHVWLPESMEGPTPISALIHAATMVTAGVYMVCRMSPLFEFSLPAQSMVIILGGLTCLSMGLLAVFQNDIKRVIAYSTLSQLGYMMVGVGASAYAAGMFHLMTHACFKALLFLAAGSVIIGMRHEQDMRKMGGLWRYMPVTWGCFLVGALSLSALPLFSGFYSKDTIIEAAHLSSIPGSTFAYVCVLSGAFITALYTFRCFFMTFHGQTRMDDKAKSHIKESPWVVTAPLIALAIPSAILGSIAIYPLLYATPSAFGSSIFVLPKYDVLAQLAKEFHGPFNMAVHALATLPFWLELGGIFTAWLFVLGLPQLGGIVKKRFKWLYYIMVNKYGFDAFNQVVFANGIRRLGGWFYRIGDLKIVDGFFVNGSGYVIQWCSRTFRRIQTGYLYHYALAMVLGLFALLAWLWVGY